MIKIGVVTDDFTGAASAGMMLAQHDVNTLLFYDKNLLSNVRGNENVEAIYVSSNSRHLSPNNAYDAVSQTMTSLQKFKPMYYSKKIDTTLRGNIGNEIDAMLDLLDDDYLAVFVSSMPQSKRNRQYYSY